MVEFIGMIVGRCLMMWILINFVDWAIMQRISKNYNIRFILSALMIYITIFSLFVWSILNYNSNTGGIASADPVVGSIVQLIAIAVSTVIVVTVKVARAKRKVP